MRISLKTSAALVSAVLVGVFGVSRVETQQRSPVAPGGNRPAVASDKDAVPVFPDADRGADPSVSAEQGGRGFTGQGWQTNTTFGVIGDSRAVNGGTFRQHIRDFPGTLRIRGPEANTTLNSMIAGIVYESLLSLHPTTLDYIPALATHWQISPDRLTYRFRIDPNARWSDGQPVVADDVVATWVLPHGQRPSGSKRAAHLRKVRETGRREQVHRPCEEHTAQLA
jgi:ABC-type transport system substrate-binding protein